MRKLKLTLGALAAIALLSFTVFQPTTIKIGEKVTSAGTSEVVVQLNYVRPNVQNGSQLIYVQLDPNNSGTIQFSVGEAIVAGHYAWPASSKFPITIKNGVANLRYKASASSQSFVVTQ
jgi:hypothetical protein